LERLATGDAGLEHFGVVERPPDGVHRRLDAFGSVHIHDCAPSSLCPVLRQRWPRRRAIVISARIESAISSGVIAPRSAPAGALTRSSMAASKPCSASFSRNAAILRRLPTKAWYS